ncbi:MAG: insulinase family protein [Pseudomonadales bacterium]
MHHSPTRHARRLAGRLALACCALVLAGCTATDGQAPETQTSDGALVKSPNDSREYRYLTLSNKMQVLLVSDPQTDKSAASLVVQRGSFHEPKERPGIAHFLEHMLFIGTEKYPEIDAYQEFIGTHGGSSNAYTAQDHTNYFFDINPPQFRPAMDRFAQFFIGPLFEAEYVEREKNAVYSEYQLQIKDDSWRANSAQKVALNQEHPGSRFTIGSLETLDGDIRTDLLTFFKDNYSADQMILVALGNESLDSMQAWIEPMFESVANRNIGPAPELPPMFTAEQLPATMHVQSLKENYRVSFEFAVPTDIPHFRAKPLLYITNLLGHEGDGSLHQALKARGWIESLSTASTAYDNRTTIVAIDVELTDAGREQIPAITKALFDQIELLRSQPPSRRLFTEQAQMLALAFRFQESGSPTGFVYRTAPAFMTVPPAEVLRSRYLMSDFDPALISRYLDALTPDNLIRTISGPDVPTTAIEPWFQVPYALEQQAPELDQSFNAALRLPAANEFLPERVDLIDGADSKALPQPAVDQNGIQLWVAPDTQFGTPRSNSFLTLAVPNGFNSPADIVRARLYSRLVTDSLNEFSYPAYLSGLSYSLSVSASGFEIRLSGYDDKQTVLLEKVLDAFANLTIDPDKLALYKAEMAEDWRGFATERPYTQTISALSNLLLSNSWPPSMLAEAIAPVDAADLQRWARATQQQLSVQGLLHGNVRSTRPQQITRLLQQQLNLAAFDIKRSTVATNDQARRYGLDIDHADASMILYLQNADTSYRTRAGTALAAQLLRQAYFTQLRTEEQLGYVVGASYRPFRDRPGIAFIVQSPVADPAALVQRTYAFLDTRIEAVAALPAEAFEAFKTGLRSDLLELPKNLNDRSGRLWGDLQLQEPGFNSRQQLADAVAGISQQEAVVILKDLRKRLPEQQLLVYNTGKFDVAPKAGEAIQSVSALKQR